MWEVILLVSKLMFVWVDSNYALHQQASESIF